MEQIKVNVPEGCTASIEQKNGFLIVSFEPKEEKWEPKDGDIISFGKRGIGIFKRYDYSGHTDYVAYVDELCFDESDWVKENMRPATEEEKKRLFDALAKEGKRWNSETKQIEDFPRWRALHGDNYYSIGSMLTVDPQTEIGFSTDDKHYNAGNYFKTREAAEKVAEQIREIFKNSKAE